MSQAAPKEPEEASKAAAEAPTEATSSPDLFFLGMALFLTALVFFGFWPTYFGSVFLGQEPAEFGFVEISWPTHLHAGVFVGWMALLVVQTALIARGKTRSHMKLGRYGVAFGLLLILVGGLMTYVTMQTRVAEGPHSWAGVFIRQDQSLTGLAQFALLLGLGYLYRTRPEAHKRYMLIATIGLVGAANARIASVWLEEWVDIIFVVPGGPYWLLLWAYDLYTEGRIHPATLIGTGILLLGELYTSVVQALLG